MKRRIVFFALFFIALNQAEAQTPLKIPSGFLLLKETHYDAGNGVVSGNFNYKYDDNWNLIQKTNEYGLPHAYKYDENNRLIQESMFAGNMGGQTWVYNYDSRGNLATQTDPHRGILIFYSYDVRNRLVRKLTGILGPEAGEMDVTEYRYNERGELIEVTDVSKGKTTYYFYEYNQGGKADGIRLPSTLPLPDASPYVYRLFDRQGRLVTEWISIDKPGVQSYICFTYSYDGKGLPVQRNRYTEQDIFLDYVRYDYITRERSVIRNNPAPK